ncbi:hypothetical protein JOL79_17915 [Microbispora sp. RL4-1S]|uniref:Uncharacterized protein n=1 Tax=Microbispora oryzae TaxID=2806554 RepID=A0A940WHA3_9ACTN|nr:hypothetical protein [Microbispora oryzae]MBP2705694.1 hypothetical protein [Microbispora oryzae]
MGAVTPGTGPLSPDFSGISPEAMGRFVAELEHARGVIGERAEAVRRVLAATGLPAASLAPIGEAERWLDDSLPDLRRRHRLADRMTALPSWSPSAAGLVPYREQDVLSAAEAGRLGRELALFYRSVDPDAPFDPGLGDAYRKLVDTLAAHADDAEFAAAFFAGIGPRRTVELPRRLRQHLEEGVEQALATVSRALGDAVGGGASAPGFAAVAAAIRTKTENDDDRESIGELLSAGRFPTEWLAQVVAVQAFLPGDRSSGPALTPYLTALGNHPEAGRLAISLVTRDSPPPRDTLKRLLAPTPALASVDRRPDLAAFLRDLNSRAATDPGSADAFGRMLAAASGAYDEKDGAHSEPAARFAFTVITGAARFPFAGPTRVHLAEIAGAYATEITAGADLGGGDQLLPSAFEPVRSRIAGLRPAFRLSPADTYRFMLTFAASETDRLPFESAMGDLARRLVRDGVPAMLASKNPTALDDVFAALGNVRGFELAAVSTYGKARDDAVEADKQLWSAYFGTALGVAGLAVPGMAGAIVWTGLSTGWSLYDTYSPDPEKETDKLEAMDRQETLGRQHTIAQLLMDAGFPAKVSPGAYQATCPPGVAVAGEDGRLRPFPDIIRSGEAGARALDQWFITNGMGSDDNLSIGTLSRKQADIFDGRKNNAAGWAETYG